MRVRPPVAIRTTLLAASSFLFFSLVALAAESEIAVVVTDPSALVLEAGDLPRGYRLVSEPGPEEQDGEIERLARAIREAADRDEAFDAGIATQSVQGPTGPLSLIVIAVRKGDPAALAREVTSLRAGRFDSVRYGNAVLVFATDDRSQRTILSGAVFSRYVRLARAAADARARAGDPKGALACLETIFELSPDDPRGRVRAGELALVLDPTGASARDHFERGLRTLEKSKPAARPPGLLLDARLAVARLERDRGEIGAAELRVRRAAQELEADDWAGAARAGYELAALLAVSKQGEESLDTLERALVDASKSNSKSAATLAERARADAAFSNVAAVPRFKSLLDRFAGKKRE